jgi:RNA polymerase sigma-70 factor (ECF subfamily)
MGSIVSFTARAGNRPRRASVPRKKAPARPEPMAASLDERNRRLADWMKAARAGDSVAFDRLFRELAPLVRTIAQRKGVPVDFLDDVVQETLLTVHRIQASYDPDRPFTAWLRMIAQRRAIDLLRSHGRVSGREVHAPIAFENHADSAENIEDRIEQIDRENISGIAIASLPARQREAVEQLALSGRSIADAANATGLTPGALRVNLYRALATLRARVGSDPKLQAVG